MTDAVELLREGAVATLRLNRPDKKNALSEAMWRALPERLAEAESDPAIRVLIVTGAGGDFAAGADISEFETVYATPERAAAYSDAVNAALDGLAAFPKPSLARIEGACIGGGCGVALACDMRFAAETARFGVTPARLGLVYPLNDTARLIDAVGLSRAKDLLFTARLLEAPEAEMIGLIDQILPGETLDAVIAAYAERLIAMSGETARATKKIIGMIQAGRHQDDHAARAIFRDAFAGPDFAEGYRAFMEKRAPRFPGRSE